MVPWCPGAGCTRAGRLAPAAFAQAAFVPAGALVLVRNPDRTSAIPCRSSAVQCWRTVPAGCA
eukprot:11022337-Alexandrium_andersonii.AAC.1